jgi:hypothetical protein
MKRLETTEPAILLCISRLHKTHMSGVVLYDICRGVWAVGGDRRNLVKLAFAVAKGRIVAVYRIEAWHRAGSTEYKSGREIDLSQHQDDWEFTGTRLPPELEGPYLEMVPPRFRGNPVRYFNVGSN